MFAFNENKVYADFADDQYIVLNHVNGDYYSFDKASSMVLKALTEGCSTDAVIQGFCNRFGEDCGAAETVKSFVDRLVSLEIVVPCGNTTMDAVQYIAAIECDKMPELTCEIFTDVADLLQMDPIHEVDEKAGWPVKKPD